nr:MAG TPA: hypothetical protein [Caudoviricetes sp.]
MFIIEGVYTRRHRPSIFMPGLGRKGQDYAECDRQD